MEEFKSESNFDNLKSQNIIVNQAKSESNGLGIAGFVISLLALFLGWIPFLGWFLWLLGVIFSFIGVFKKPRGFAIAGLVISFIVVILLIFVFASLALIGAASS